MEIMRYYRQLENSLEGEEKRIEYEVLTVRKEDIEFIEKVKKDNYKEDNEDMFSELEEISREIDGIGHFIVGRSKSKKLKSKNKKRRKDNV